MTRDACIDLALRRRDRGVRLARAAGRRLRRRRVSRSTTSRRHGRESAMLDGWWMDEVWDFVRLLARAAGDDLARHPASAASSRHRASCRRRHAIVIGDHAGRIVDAEGARRSSRSVVLRRDGRPDPASARDRTCTRSRGSSGRATSARDATVARRSTSPAARSATAARCTVR